MKKALSVLLVICICFGMFSVIPATAVTGSTADISMGTASGKIGDTLAVDLTLNNNPGFGTLGVRVSYDTTKLQLVSVTDKKVFTNGDSANPYTNSGTDSPIQNNPYLIVWQDNVTLTNTTNTGKLATFNFKVLAGATIGQNPITVSVLNCYQANLNSTAVPTTVTNGSITAACAVHTPAANWTVTKAATCTEDGTRVKYCTVCGLVAESETIPATGHNWGAWSVVTPATLTSKGLEQRVCLNDASHIETREIPMLIPVDVSMGNASGKVGDTVAVDLTLNRNPGFGTLGIVVNYDATKLQLISVTDKKVLTNGDSSYPYTNVGIDSAVSHTPYLIVWQDSITLTNTTNTGKLATFNFKILDGATIGQNPITLSVKNCYQADLDLTTVPTVVANGYVNAQYTVSYDSQGGSAVASVNADNNASISAPADPTKSGYTFAGWYTSTGTKITFPYTVTGNATLYAHWTINNYTIAFNSNGGSAVANKTADYNTAITAPTAPTKTGYTFAGWYKDAELTSAWNFTTDVVVAATTLYAKWTINNYTVTFNSNGGSVVANKTADYNTAITAPADPTKIGYTFQGWYTALTGGTKVTFPYTVTTDTTLYAQWIINNYTISFNSNGGSAVANKTADYNTAFTSPVAPTKTGYTFVGWFKDAALTIPWNFATDVVVDNITLYAKWNVNNYTVTFDSNGGSTVANKVAAYNTAVTSPADPTKTGYTFAGWYTALTGGTMVTFPYTVTADTTVYALWTINTYNVSFNSNGGSSVTGKTANYSTTITAPADPTKTGYTFAGWYKEAALTNAWNFASDVVTADTTLFAKWNINSYTVTFDPKGGSAVASKIADYNTTITTPTDPTMTGFNFAGWFTLATGGTKVDFPYTVTGDVTLYAQWTPIYTPGNINGDDDIDLKDVTTLSRYLAGWTVTVIPEACDANGDGIVDLKDVTLISRYIAGWDVVLH